MSTPRWRPMKHGTVKRIHVNKAVVFRNAKDGTNLPAITIQHSHGPTPCRQVRILGPSVLHQDVLPIASGARVYIYTTAALEYLR